MLYLILSLYKKLCMSFVKFSHFEALGYFFAELPQFINAFSFDANISTNCLFGIIMTAIGDQ